MTVKELIALLERYDQNAVVALRYDCDDNGVVTCEELRLGQVQAAALRKLQSWDSWYDPLAGAQLYRLCEDDDPELPDANNGVLLGYLSHMEAVGWRVVSRTQLWLRLARQSATTFMSTCRHSKSFAQWNIKR